MYDDSSFQDVSHGSSLMRLQSSPLPMQIVLSRRGVRGDSLINDDTRVSSLHNDRNNMYDDDNLCNENSTHDSDLNDNTILYGNSLRNDITLSLHNKRTPTTTSRPATTMSATSTTTTHKRPTADPPTSPISLLPPPTIHGHHNPVHHTHIISSNITRLTLSPIPQHTSHTPVEWTRTHNEWTYSSKHAHTNPYISISNDTYLIIHNN